MKKTLIAILIILMTFLFADSYSQNLRFFGSNRGSGIYDTLKYDTVRFGDTAMIKTLTVDNSSTDNYLIIKNISSSDADSFYVFMIPKNSSGTSLTSDSIRIGGINIYDNSVVTLFVVANSDIGCWKLLPELIGDIRIRKLDKRVVGNKNLFGIYSGNLKK